MGSERSGERGCACIVVHCTIAGLCESEIEEDLPLEGRRGHIAGVGGQAGRGASNVQSGLMGQHVEARQRFSPGCSWSEGRPAFLYGRPVRRRRRGGRPGISGASSRWVMWHTYANVLRCCRGQQNALRTTSQVKAKGRAGAPAGGEVLWRRSGPGDAADGATRTWVCPAAAPACPGLKAGRGKGRTCSACWGAPFFWRVRSSPTIPTIRGIGT